MHDVVDLLRVRRDAGSRPGERSDGARVALVIEGGGSRAAVGGGMVSALESRGLLPAFDAVYGVSAGVLNGAWFVCERANANVHGWWEPEIIEAVILPRRLLRARPVVDADHLIDHVYDFVTPMGFEEILASPVEYHPLATDAATGEAVDLAPFIRDVPSLRDVLRASTRLPVLGGPLIEIEGRQFLDAGLAENVPVTTAFAQGATHVLALRTQQPREFRPRPSRLEDRVVRTWLSRRAPGALGAWTARHERVLAEERLLATDPRVRQIAPPESAPSVGLLSRTTETLRQAVAIGRAAVDEVLGERTEGGTPPGSGSPRL